MNDDDEMELYDASEYTTNEWSDAPDYAPSTATVRATYATDYYMTTVRGGMTAMARAAAFDRWLARVRAEAAAESLETWTATVREELRATLKAGIDLGEQYMLGMRSALSQADERAAELREEANRG